MNGAESLLRAAADAGSSVCFANPGTTEMPLVAAIDAVAEIRPILGLFEGVCTGAADGFGRMTGRPALTLLHLGPGLANGLANLHNARRARSPVVNLIGDHTTWHLAHDAPLTSDIVSLASPVSKWVHTCTTPQDLPKAVAEAIESASSAPAGVSSLILPVDLQWEDCGPSPAASPAHSRHPAAQVPDDRIAAVSERLARGTGGLILGGTGLSQTAQRTAARIASATGARVWVETFPARWERGAHLPTFERLPYFPEQAIEALGELQTLACAGATDPVAFFGYQGIASRLAPEGASLLLASPEEDVEDALERLAEHLDAPAAQPGERHAPPQSPAAAATGPLNSGSIGSVLAAALPEGAIVVDEAATSGLAFYAASEDASPHSLLSLTGGAIGQGLPCATGAAVACPDRRVIAFQADGSAAYTAQALWTQAREGLDVTTLLCSNRAYRILQVELARAGVTQAGEGASSLMSLGNPDLDWCSIAKGYGVPATRVEDAEALTRALDRALAEPGPQLVEMVI